MTVLTVPSTTDFSGQTLNDVHLIDFTNGLLDFVASAGFAHTQFLGSGPQIRSTVIFDGSGSATVNAFVNRVVVSGGSINASDWGFTNWFANDTVTLNGADRSDKIFGTFLKDTINGSGGNDVLIGRGGADILNGGLGNDTFKFFQADIALGETIDGGAGADDQLIAAGDINLGAATLSNVESLIFESGLASPVTVSGATALQFGASAINRVTGGLGLDTLVVNAATIDMSTVTFLQWVVTDVIRIAGFSSNDLLTGTSHNDTVVGGLGNDTLNGGDGNDKFLYFTNGEVGTTESVAGGAGTADALVLGASGAFGFAALGSLTGVEEFDFGDQAGNNIVLFDDAQIGSAGIRRVEGNSLASDTLTVGGAEIDLSSLGFDNWTVGTDTILLNADSILESTIVGSRKNDVVNGGSLDDLLQGHAGADVINGGNGIDTASYIISGAVTVDLKANTATGSHAGGDSFTSIENLIGSNGGDNLTGDDNNNRLNGGDGNDVMKGGRGIDALFGGAGNDRFVYNGGFDIVEGETVRGGDGTADRIIIANSDAAVMQINRISILDVERLEFDVFGDSSLNGVSLEQPQIGAGARSITTVSGSTAEDRLSVKGRDSDLSSVTFLNWSASDSITVSNGTNLSSNIIGSTVNDTVTGGASGARDIMDGGAGNDNLVGFGGRDTMTGGLGQDVFKITDADDSTLGVNRDIITDFAMEPGGGASFVDRLEFNFSVFEVAPNEFIGTDAFTDELQVRAVQSGANTIIQVNLVGTSDAEMEIVLKNVTANDLTTADFLFT